MTIDAEEQATRRLAKNCGWRPEKSRRDGTWQLCNMTDGRVLKAKGRDSHGCHCASSANG